MKIPFSIKFNNAKVRPMLGHKDFLDYFLKIIALNYDELKAQNHTPTYSYLPDNHFYARDEKFQNKYSHGEQTSKEKTFIKTLYEQSFLNSVAQTIYIFEELRNLEKASPVGFAQQFQGVQIYFSSIYRVDKLRAGFSDSEAEALNQIPYHALGDKDSVLDTVFSQYIRLAQSVQPLAGDWRRDTNIFRELNEQAQAVFCSENPDNSFRFEADYVGYMCELIKEAFEPILKNKFYSTFMESTVLKQSKAEALRSEFNTQVFKQFSAQFKLSPQKPKDLYGMGEREIILHSTHHIEPIYWQALENTYPHLYVQVEKQKIKSLELFAPAGVGLLEKKKTHKI